MLSIDKEEIDYPREVFQALIDGDSPYAFYLFQWVPYQTDARRWRLKMLHDVKHFDGRIEYQVWPNGNSCGSFRDEEVEFIRISKEQFGHEWKDPRVNHEVVPPSVPAEILESLTPPKVIRVKNKRERKAAKQIKGK